MRDINYIKPYKMNIIKKMILGTGLLFFLNILVLSAQPNLAENALHLDPGIRHGQLSNGLTYYIKHVENASKKTNMHLYVKVGCYYEKQNQLDFAHALEHLAFKCAPNFPMNLMGNPKLLTRFGMEKYDIFGRTGNMHTSYNFDIPSNNMDAMDTGLLWFYDISDLALTTEKIDEERGPLRQEVTFKQGSKLEDKFVETQMESELFPFELDFSNFFNHNRSFSPTSLVEFYKQWYQPDRMGIVIVGDIQDIGAVERKIKARFSGIKGHSKPWIDFHLQYLERPEQFVAVEQGVGKQGTETVEFYLYLRDKKIIDERQTWKGIKRKVIWGMLSKLMLLNNRFKEAGQVYNTLFTAFGHYGGSTFPAYRIKITAAKDEGQESFKKTIRILDQVKKFGFTREEWKDARKEQLKTMQSIDTTQPKYWLEQINNHYVHGEALPIAKATGLQQWFSGLSLKDFNALVSQYLSEIVNDIGIIVPHGQKSLYSETKVRRWVQEVLGEERHPYTVPEIPKQLISARETANLKERGYNDRDRGNSEPVLKNGRVLRKAKSPGVRELVLDNGVKLVLDTSGVKSNKVHLRGFNPKGASCFPEEDYFSAINAPFIIKNAGIGNMDKFALNRFLAKTTFWQGVLPYIDYRETGIKGNANTEDFEKLLQLVYLYFTQPRKDKIAFEDWKAEERDRHLNPTYGFLWEDYNVAMREFLEDSSVAPKGTKRLQGIPKTDMDRAYAIYQQLYGNAKDFTFLISGGFSINKVLPLLQKYLGNLPNLSDGGICLSNKVVDKNLPKRPVYQKFSPQEMGAFYNMESVMYSLRFVGKTGNLTDWKERIKVDALGDLMDSKVKGLRYVKGFSLYNTRAWSQFNRSLSSFDFEIRLDIVPEELEALRKACKEMVSEIQSNSFSEERFEEVIQNRFIKRYVAKQNSTFHRRRQLHGYYAYKEPWVPSSEIVRYVKSLTREDIQKTAQKYLKEGNLMEFVMQNKNSSDNP